MSQRKSALLRLPLLALAAAVVLLQLAGLLGRLDHALADRQLAWHASSRPAPTGIVLVAIDQKSLEDLNEVAGTWPWPRAVHAELIDGLSRFGPAAIAFDVTFNESDGYRPDSDQALREVALGQDTLYFASVLLADGNPGPLAQLPESFGATRGPGADPGARAPLLLPHVLAPESWRGGLINFEADEDGLGRHVRLRYRVDGWVLPGFAARVAADRGATLPAADRIRLHWYGQPPRTLPFADLFEDLSRPDPVLAPTLAGQVVIVAATAPGLNDVRPTPLGSQTPGPEVLATAIANLRDGDWLHDQPSRWPLMLALVALLSVAFARRASPVASGLGLGLASLAAIAGSQLALGADLYLPVGAALAVAWLGFALLTVNAHLLERRDREATIGLFGRFLDPRVVDSLVESGELRRDRKPESRQISILFSDIRGFTTLSETRSPEDVVELLNRYFTRQVDVIFRHGGTLDKFMGDAIMAFWNAPTAQPDHAERAVAAALEMTTVLDAFRRELAEADGQLADFDIGIGVHSGPAVVGFLGSDTRMEYTAIGDTVNLGSRIEGATKGVARVLVSDATRAACRNGRVDFTHRGQFKVKGREQPVDLYEPTPVSVPAPEA